MNKKSIYIILAICLIAAAAGGCRNASQEKESQNAKEHVGEVRQEDEGLDSVPGLQNKAEEEARTDWSQGNSDAREEEAHKGGSKDNPDTENSREEKDSGKEADGLGGQEERLPQPNTETGWGAIS